MTTSKFERLHFQRIQAEKQAFSTQTELADLVQSVIAMPDKAVLDQVKEIEETRHLFELVDAVDLENQGIDLTITCAKSGNFIHQFTIHDYLALREIHGEARAIEIMQSRQFSAISPQWLYTDNKALDALQIADPYGYCAYSLSKLLLPLPLHKKMEDMPFHIRADWHKQKSDACITARKIPLHGLVELNEMLRRFLAITIPGKAGLKFTHKRLDDALDNWRELLQELKDNLETLLTKAINSGQISRHLSYGDMVELNKLYQGYSNFRLQRKPREKSEMDHIGDLIDEIFPDDSNIPRYMAGHEPEFVPQGKKRETIYTAADLDKMINEAVADIDAQTRGEKPVSDQKPSFLQMIALRKKQ